MNTPGVTQRLARSVPTLVLAVSALLVVFLAIQNGALREEARTLRRRVALPYAGLTVPTFRAATLAGDSVVIGEGETGRRQVLLVFTTTCGFCLENLPAWKTIVAELGALHAPEVAVYGISLDPEAETRRYVIEHELPFPVLEFPDPRTARLYRAKGVPITLVLDHEGTVLHARLGALGDRRAIDSVITAVRQPQSTRTITSR